MNILYAKGTTADNAVAYLWGCGNYQYTIEKRYGAWVDGKYEVSEDVTDIDGDYAYAMKMFEDEIVPGSGVLL